MSSGRPAQMHLEELDINARVRVGQPPLGGLLPVLGCERQALGHAAGCEDWLPARTPEEYAVAVDGLPGRGARWPCTARSHVVRATPGMH